MAIFLTYAQLADLVKQLSEYGKNVAGMGKEVALGRTGVLLAELL